MKINNIIKILSIVFYCLIILKGSMIALPFFIYLFFNMLCLGTISQIITSIIGVLGLIIVMKQMKLDLTFKRIFIEFLGLIMLTVPLIERVNSAPIELFHYLTFKIPTILFLILYLVSLCILTIEFLKMKQGRIKKNSR
jgi:hypothetical protein